jgi:hypothetical protein
MSRLEMLVLACAMVSAPAVSSAVGQQIVVE